MNKQPLRRAAINFLTAISVDKERRMFGATEAFCTWFDDLKINDLSEEKRKENFTKEEFSAILTFHETFGGISDGFDVERDWKEIESDQDWIELIERAKQTLEILNPEAEPDATGQRR